jgi:hypothetical protein
MIANSLLLTVVLMTVLLFALMGELSYLARYREHLLTTHGVAIALFFACLFVNVFAAVHTLNRKFFLKGAGQKLSLLDKQIRDGSDLTLPAEIERSFGRH